MIDIKEKRALATLQRLIDYGKYKKTKEKETIKKELKSDIRNFDTICWKCENVLNNCQKPVDGWVAEYKALSMQYKRVSKKIDSWIVRSCPNFREEKRG